MSDFLKLVQSGEKSFGKVLAELLVDAVDRSLFDSGGVYGVAADRARQAAEALAITPHQYYEAQAASVYRVDKWGLEWSHNIYHWLKEKVTYRADITMKFYDFIDFAYAHENHGKVPIWEKQYSEFSGRMYWGWEEVHSNYTTGAKLFLNHIWQIWPDEAQDWDDMPETEWQSRYDMLAAWLEAHPEGYDPGLIGGDGHYTENTCNHEDILSRTMQYYSFPYDGDLIYAISIHGGADVRSGYSDVIFCEGKEGWYDLADNTRGTLYCNECNAYWDTDNGGYHFDSSFHNEKEIELDKETIVANAERDAEGEMTGRLCCPACKKGILHASF